MTIKLAIQIMIFMFCFLASVGLFMDGTKFNKNKLFLLIHFAVIVAYIIKY